MKKIGWYAMRRGWMDHEMFRKTEYSEREAWVWLIENAVYEERMISVLGNPTKLHRGQLSYSMRFLKKAWNWNLPKVHRYLQHLDKWNAIKTQTDTGQTVITICNYDKYQSKLSKDDTDNINNTVQKRNTCNTNINKETSKQENVISDEIMNILDSTV